ncbi:hypothetical protein vseg_011821 [Gypsophila vaccaria]
MKKKVLNSGHYLFDSKPLIFKEWSAEMKMKKTEIFSVPTWIQLHQLPLKFWGKSLPKIAGLVGKYIQSDTATEHKTKLGFARVMVEVEVDQQFPDHISFRDEVGQVMKIAVEYEWKPITCSKCHKMGHATEVCRKDQANKPKVKPSRKVWIPVKNPWRLPHSLCLRKCKLLELLIKGPLFWLQDLNVLKIMEVTATIHLGLCLTGTLCPLLGMCKMVIQSP